MIKWIVLVFENFLFIGENSSSFLSSSEMSLVKLAMVIIIAGLVTKKSTCNIITTVTTEPELIPAYFFLYTIKISSSKGNPCNKSTIVVKRLKKGK